MAGLSVNSPVSVSIGFVGGLSALLDPPPPDAPASSLSEPHPAASTLRARTPVGRAAAVEVDRGGDLDAVAGGDAGGQLLDRRRRAELVERRGA
jgi:hypothetical protein